MKAEVRSLQKPIGIIGYGKSGEAAHQLLLAAGILPHEIFVFDDNKSPEIKFSDFIKNHQIQTICVSPGVPLNKPEIQQALNEGVQLTSELEIAFRFITTEKIISITGSIGKSTVTSLIGEGLKRIDKNSFIGGNLGTPLAEYSRKLIKGEQIKANYVTLELSSYQLENFKNLQSDCSVITYLSANHMERYTSLEHYYQTKFKLLAQTKHHVIFNSNGGDLETYFSLFFKDNFSFGTNDFQSHFPQLKPKTSFVHTCRENDHFLNHLKEKPCLLGAHNLDNLALAFAVFDFFKCPTQSYLAATRYPGLPHRLENLGQKNEILFVNDSKATAMESVIEACHSLAAQFPNRSTKILIGGKDKNLPWDKLSILSKQSHFQFIFFGSVGTKAKNMSQLPGPVFEKLSEALLFTKQSLPPNGIVLLSPGGTSLDEFKSFEERGDFFKNWFSSLET